MFQHAAHSENEELEDSTAGTGDSGFSEAEQWKRYMQHPPSRPPIPGISLVHSHHSVPIANFPPIEVLLYNHVEIYYRYMSLILSGQL